MYPVCVVCLEIRQTSRRLSLLCNEILALLNVAYKIREHLRNTRIQIHSYQSNRFYLVILKKLSESIAISGKLENKQM